MDLVGGRREVDGPASNTGLGTPGFLDLGAIEFSADLGRYFCEAANNSTGVPARIHAGGSLAVSDNDLTLSATDLPPLQFGILITSPFEGGPLTTPGQGILCLGPPFGRLNQPGQIVLSSAAGEVSLDIDLTQVPGPSSFQPVLPGETRHFQFWFRDVVGGAQTNNLSDAVGLSFE